MASTNAKWTEQDAAKAVDLYIQGKTVAEIVSALNDVYRPRQVIGQLVTKKVYKAPEKAPAQPRDPGPTKAEIAKTIAEQADFDMTGGDNASKDFLTRLAAKLGVTVTSE